MHFAAHFAVNETQISCHNSYFIKMMQSVMQKIFPTSRLFSINHSNLRHKVTRLMQK